MFFCFSSPSPASTAYKRVFVTSTTYNGNLAGLNGADSKCQTRADTANLGGTWKAWLSDYITSSSRLNHFNGPYKLINGITVADNWTDLTDSSIQNAIKITELGSEQGTQAWTNTEASGNIPSSGRSCVNWTSSYDDSGSLSPEIRGGGLAGGIVGNPTLSNPFWSNSSIASCNLNLSLYCFEQ